MHKSLRHFKPTTSKLCFKVSSYRTMDFFTRFQIVLSSPYWTWVPSDRGHFTFSVNCWSSYTNLWMVYSCCSHLEHRASVERFVSLQFLNLRHSVGPLRRVISPSQGRYLTQTQNKRTQTSMPQMGFEPTIPAFERAKTVHVLDRAATVITQTCAWQ
jgi:hypothetical protein